MPYRLELVVPQASADRETSGPSGRESAGEFSTSIDTLQAVLPNTKMIVVSPLFARTPRVAEVRLRDKLKGACLARIALPILDVLDKNASLSGSDGVGLRPGYGNTVCASCIAGRIAPLLVRTN